MDSCVIQISNSYKILYKLCTDTGISMFELLHKYDIGLNDMYDTEKIHQKITRYNNLNKLVDE